MVPNTRYNNDKNRVAVFREVRVEYPNEIIDFLSLLPEIATVKKSVKNTENIPT